MSNGTVRRKALRKLSKKTSELHIDLLAATLANDHNMVSLIFLKKKEIRARRNKHKKNRKRRRKQ